MVPLISQSFVFLNRLLDSYWTFLLRGSKLIYIRHGMNIHAAGDYLIFAHYYAPRDDDFMSDFPAYIQTWWAHPDIRPGFMMRIVWDPSQPYFIDRNISVSGVMGMLTNLKGLLIRIIWDPSQPYCIDRNISECFRGMLTNWKGLSLKYGRNPIQSHPRLV